MSQVLEMKNTLSEPSYLLPADAREHDRLAAQHLMWKHLFDGLLPSELDSEVNSLLESAPNAMVLDVGCGAGHWSFDFALKYPSAKVVGLDLTNSMKLDDDAPPNFEFVQGDVTKDMAQFFGKFDLLNCRAVLAHINDAVSALDVLHRCLKPGGFIVISEGDTRVFSRDMKTWAPMAVETDQDNSRSWVARFLYELEMLNGKGAVFGRDLSRRLKGTAGFEDIYVKDYYSPFGWDGEDVPHGRQLSATNRVNITSLALGYRPTFLRRNHAPESTIDKWCKGVEDEVADPAVERYVVFHVAWARRAGNG